MSLSNLFFYSDPHFGHANLLNFINYDGDRVRSEFDSIEDMDETLVERYNSRITDQDKVWFLGDIAFKLDVYHRIMPRLRGKKRLILGNHDGFQMSEYMRHFQKIQESWQPVRDVLFTHRPVFMGSKEGDGKINVHGHVHRTRDQLSPKHLNISCEMTDYAPIAWEEICDRIGRNYDR